MNCKQTYTSKMIQNDRSVPVATVDVNAVVSVGVVLSESVDAWLRF